MPRPPPTGSPKTTAGRSPPSPRADAHLFPRPSSVRAPGRPGAPVSAVTSGDAGIAPWRGSLGAGSSVVAAKGGRESEACETDREESDRGGDRGTLAVRGRGEWGDCCESLEVGEVCNSSLAAV